MLKIGDFIKLQGGYAFKSAELSDNPNGHPVIKIGNITGGSFVSLDSYQTVSDEIFNKAKAYQTEPNDILIAMTGANVGKVSRVPYDMPKCGINQRVGRFLLKDNCQYSSDFIYYLVSSKKSYEYFSRIADGAAQPNISGSLIESLEFPDIDVENANKVGEILKSLDEKIQLNTQANQTLEAIAQAIFKSWFVDFDPLRAKAQALREGKTSDEANLAAMAVISGKAVEDLSQTEYQQLWEIADTLPSELVENAEFCEVPKGWKYTTLSEICTMQNGYAFKSSDWRDNGIPVIKIGSIQSNIVNVFGNGFVDLEYTETKKDFVLKSGDIVIALTGAYVGKAGIMPANSLAMLNQRVAKFLAKTISNNVSYYSYIYCLSQRTELKDFISFTAQGSAQPNISTKELLAFKILLGNKELHLYFEKVCKILLDKMISNSGENENLSSIRDLLLPKLLSGEIEL